MLPPPRSARWKHTALLAALGAAFLFPALDRLVMSREQELRVALTARTMAQGGSWLLPEYLGQLRVRKPPLMNWLVAATFSATGSPSSAAAARLPSALAGIGLMLVIHLAATPFLGRRRAFVAALVAGTSLIFLRQARLAETDMLLALFTTGAALSGFYALTRPDALRAWWIAGLCAGLGFLTKGPAALILPLLAWTAFAVAFAKQRRAAAPQRAWPIAGAFLAFAAVALPWYAYILHKVGDPVVQQQLQDEIARATSESFHPGPWYYYAYTTFHGLAPWSLLLPWALAWGWRRRHRPLPLFALCWFATTFAVLSVLSSKQVHYTLLMLPPAAILTGDFLAAGLAASTRRGHAAHRLLLAILGGCAIGGLVVAAAPWWAEGDLASLPLLLAGLAMALAAAWGVVERAHPRRALAAGIVALWLAVMSATWLILPAAKPERVIRDTIAQVRPLLAAAPRVFVAGDHRPVMEFYAGRATSYRGESRDAWRAARPDDVIVAVRDGKTDLPQPLLAAGRAGSLVCEVVRKPGPTPAP